MYTIKGKRSEIMMRLTNVPMPPEMKDCNVTALVVDHPTDVRAVLELLQLADVRDLDAHQIQIVKDWAEWAASGRVRYFESAHDEDAFFVSVLESAFLRADTGSAAEWNASEILFQLDVRKRSQINDDFEMRFSLQTPGGRSDEPIPSIRLMSPPSAVRH